MEASSVANQHSYSFMQLAKLDSSAVEKTDVSWNEIAYFLDTPLKTPDQDDQIETTRDLMVAEDHAKRTNWEDWTDQLITVNDDTLDANWSDLLVDDNLSDSEPKLLDLPPKASSFQQLHRQPLPSVNGCQTLGYPSASSSKARMHWTQELHEVFVDSVNKLGGCDRAAPKVLLKLMNVEGLTIYHVKSHLQKYRSAIYKPESLEGTRENKSQTTSDMTSLDLKTTMGITESLRMQIEVQKQLHEQLEIQRTLQVQIEQGKHLQEMFEQQRISADEHPTKKEISSDYNRAPSKRIKMDTLELPRES